MGTIEQAAFDAYTANRGLPEKYRIPDDCYIDWFTKGVKFARRWISVGEELPEYAGYVLIKDKHSGVSTAFCYSVNGKTKFAIDREGISSKDVTHWRHIELK
jgi:hypothetical protein